MKSLIGIKFAKLTVISYALPDKNGHTRLNCQCACGTMRPFLLTNISRGLTKSCGCLIKERFSNIYYSKKRLFQVYKSLCAKKRGFKFELEFEDFIELTQQNCFYCGDPPQRLIKNRSSEGILFNGLDRIDNDFGYTKNNVVPCCWACNSAKMNLTQEEFFNRIRNCYNHLINGF